MFHGVPEVAAGLPVASDKSAYLLPIFHFLIEELQMPGIAFYEREPCSMQS
jgi:hypothetical protein